MTDAAAVLKAWHAEPAHVHVERLAEELRRPIYLVGGAIRDALLGRKVEDWDLCLADSAAIAEELAHLTQGRLVVLHEHIASFRIILGRARPKHCLDISDLRGPDIATDLARRDLTINALAFNVLTHELLDPLGAASDLQQGILRAIGLENLRADPLRCLRTYRLHSELGLPIEPQTRAWLHETAPLVPAMPGERISEELLRSLTPPRATETLRLMDEDGVLGELIPEIEPNRGVVQGRYHHLDVWGHTLEVVGELEHIILEPQRFFPRTHHSITRYLEQRHLAPVLLMTALLHDLAKAHTHVKTPEGWRRFYDHDRLGAEMARRIARRFRMRRGHVHLMSLLIRNHLRPLQLTSISLPQDGREPGEITRHALVRLFRAVAPHGIGLLLLALADARGCRGPATAPGFHDELADLLDDMLGRYLAWLHSGASRPLLTGRDLIKAGYKPGERFGRVLAAVEDAQVEDVVSSREEALAMALRMLEDNSG